MDAPETGRFVTLFRLVALIVCVACAREPTRTAPAPSPSVKTRVEPDSQQTTSTAFAESITRAFRANPDSVLALLNPDRAPTDVQVAAVLLESSAGEEKIQFARYLARQGDRSGTVLADAARRADDWQTLVSVLQTMGRIGDRSAVPAIGSHLSSPNSWVRMAACHALGDLGGQEAANQLVAVLQDTTDTVVSAALIALGKTGERTSLDQILTLLDHENPRVRAAAVSAVGRIGTTPSRLEPLLLDTDAGVRFKAQQAIDRIRGKEMAR